MTEREWAECTDPRRILDFAADKLSERRLRLIAVACCRPLWDSMTEACSRDAVLTAERFADGLADREQLAESRNAIKATFRNRHRQDVLTAAWLETFDAFQAERRASRWAGAWDAAKATLRAVALDAAQLTAAAALVTLSGPNGPDRRDLEAAEKERQIAILRDIIGDPFRHPSLCPEWLTADSVPLAHAAYDEQILPAGHLDLERLAVLSDALEEAGCDDYAILDHLRSPGPHVRGCWALDLVLGKE